MKKLLAIYLSFFLLFSTVAFSQDVNAFKVIFNNVGNICEQFDKNLIHFPGGNSYKIFNPSGDVREYSGFNTGIDGAYWNSIFTDFFTYQAGMFSYGETIALNHLGFFVIRSAGLEPKFEKYIFRNMLPNTNGFYFGLTPYMKLGTDQILQSYYAYTTTDHLNIVEMSDVTTLKASYKFPKELDFFNITLGATYRPLLWQVPLNCMWFVPTNPNVIVKFDLTTETFEKYDKTNLPIPIGQIFVPAKDTGLYNIKSSYFHCAYHDDNGAYHSYPVFAATRTNETEQTIDNMLLIYRNYVWDTVRIEPIGLTTYEKNKSFITRIFPLKHNSKIAICFGKLESESEDLSYRLSFSIYDIDKKTYENVVIPWEELGLSDPSVYGYSIADIKPYVDKNGVEGIGILLNRKFVFYNPTTSISETEAGIYQTLDFRNLYPNPVTQSKVTANIMCYVSDISTVELGLYNFMGQKVLDLTNDFEYEQSTATIHLNFEVPKSLQKGAYYLTVRNGDETRTKGIIIGE